MEEAKMSQEINLVLSVQEVNQVLAGLGSQPFIQVVDLINKVKAQAEGQINPTPVETEE
jgi:hypothetical protein